MLKNFSDDEFPHLPDLSTANGVLDLIAGCTLTILGNVLDFRTYSAPNQGENQRATKEQQCLWRKFDRNNIPGDERMAICYARGIALHVFKWIREFCIFKTPDGTILQDLPSKYMVDVLDALLVYKSRADRMNLLGPPHCSASMLQAQVSNVVEVNHSVKALWKERRCDSETLGIILDKGCVVDWDLNLPLAEFVPSMLLPLCHYPETHCVQHWSTRRKA
jgi:hypothetical protein